MTTKQKASITLPAPLAINGGEAVAYAMRQIDPEVVAAYPITPQTFIIERFSEYVADGLVSTEYINVESEHAALSACVGACAAGGRAQTATSGPGLALMFEIVWVASGMRLPLVMHLCSRALSAPLNILCDHSDAMAMRESSWIMMFGSNPQEAYDQAIVAPTVAEHPDVLLPFANVLDGFTVTHSVERVDVLPDEDAKSFVGEYEPERWALQPGGGATFGGLDANDFYFEHKRQQVEAMDNSLEVVRRQLDKYAELSGRKMSLVEEYLLDDAEVALVVLGSSEGMVRAAIDQARADGIKVGMLRVRLFRPFPVADVRKALSGVAAVGVLDRAIAFGAPANALMQDIVMATRTLPERPLLMDFVYGLGGRNTPKQMFREAIDHVVLAKEQGAEPESPAYLGLR
ncbi:MAG: pyruvate ferredoxin oxidoreductase [Chloroflexi bacterium]|nr:pyruvate ferredoxin oxidoreductase [Chloroflexota bacterium]MDA1298302.1 pyruvate ferredoxin oxidoreductase [Chloroflexota bacterium]